MRAGRLRHRVTSQQPTEGAADSYGATADSWSDVVANVPAEVLTLSATEAFTAQQVEAEATVQVTLRYRSDLTSAMRFVSDGRTLPIISVIPDVRHRELVCLCREDL